MEFTLGFDRAVCRRCGDPERILGVPCASCGAKAGASEVNVQVQQRRRAVANSTREAADTHEGPAEMPPLALAAPVIWARQDEELDALMKAIAAVTAARGGAAEELGLALAGIAETRGLLERFQARRPLVSRLASLRERSAALTAIAARYLEALTADTPLAAQHASDQAQREIDRAVASIDRYEALQDAARALEGDGELAGALERLISVLLAQHAGTSIPELDEAGRRRLAEVTGDEATATAGVTFLAQELSASVYLDRATWAATLAAAAGAIAANREGFAAAFTDARVRDDFQRASSLWMEAYAQATLLTRVGTTTEGLVRQLVKLYGTLIEDLVAPFGSLMLVGTSASASAREYAHLMRLDATEVVRLAHEAPELAGVFRRVEKGYRHAANHGGHAYRLHGNYVELSLRSFSTTVHWEELFDDVLALTEMVASIHLALDNALLLSGYTDHRPTNLGLYQPSIETLVRFGLEAHGMSLKSLRLQGHRMELEVLGGGPPTFAIAAASLALAPAHVDVVSVAHRWGTDARHLEVDRQGVQDHADAEIEGFLWQTVVGCRVARVDSAPWLAGGRLRAAVAAIGWDALSAEDLARTRQLKRLRAWALEAKDPAAAELLNETIRALRVGDVSALKARRTRRDWLRAADLKLP